MGYQKSREVSKIYLENASLPKHAESYTVIPHKFVIDNVIENLNSSNYTIKKETYICNQGGNVAQGIYHLAPLNYNSSEQDPDIGIMFAWTNSYDKSIRFQCSVGAYVFLSSSNIVGGEINFARKHTGTADLEIISQIESQILGSVNTFKNIVNDKNELKKITLSKREQAELIGRLYYEKDILEPSQLSMIKDEMKKSSFNYNVSNDNAWALYNHVTLALKKTHPRSWLYNSKEFHKFITTELLSNTNINTKDTYNVIDVNNVDLESNSVSVNIDAIIENPSFEL